MRKSNLKKASYLLFCTAILCLLSCSRTPQADRIFTNGHIITMNDDMPETEELALDEGFIKAAGTNAAVREAYPLGKMWICTVAVIIKDMPDPHRQKIYRVPEKGFFVIKSRADILRRTMGLRQEFSNVSLNREDIILDSLFVAQRVDRIGRRCFKNMEGYGKKRCSQGHSGCHQKQ